MDKKMSVTIDIGANISQIRAAALEAQKILGNIGADPKGTLHLKNMLSDLTTELDKLEQKSGKALTGLGDTKSVSSNIDKVETLIKNIGREIEKVGLAGETGWAKLTEGLAGKMAAASGATDKYNKTLKDTEKQYKTLKKAADDAASARDKLITQQSTIRGQRDALKGRMNQSRITNSEKPLIKAQEEAQKWAEEHQVRLNQNYSIKASDQEKLSQEQLKEYGKLLEEVIQRQERFNEIKKDQQSAKSEYDKYTKDLENLAKEEETARNQVEQTQKALEDFNKTAKDAAAFEELKKSLSQTFGDETFKNVKNLDELNEKLNELASSASGEVKTGLLQILEMMNQVSKETPKMSAELDKGKTALVQMGETSREIEHLTSRLKYFFSLAGGFQLMRRAIRSATETTKELDAAMTQTAVVSTKTVGQMWKTLPQYSAEAKKLGSSIVDVYKAQTLYVQQGLDMNSAMDLGVETLKMARVAGIDAAEATNSMTAALRGFNMELNETSATRINDVYSKLAQNTASNVQEISTAMTKTAALANSANMSFENTAAFLATIIESTREGAETAGTALKTVIARFTEVKKLYSEGELTGTDEEGQEVDVNKISKALRTAGINMNDFFAGTKGLDEIFMELGSKWSSLTTVQQRYIATMAAGSRQQSRFLALMQNYSRTVELTQMAYNSAGSGQEQFEKTLDSLEAKINKLKDEWQTFIMGLANNEAIKFFVDAGTTILSTINKIIDAISGDNGLVKAIASLTTVFGIFKGGRGLIKGAIGGSGTSGLGGILGNWLGVKNGYAEKQEQANAFKNAMRQGGLRGKRGEFLRTQWFGQGGVLDPKGRIAQQEAAAKAEVEAKYKAYKEAEAKEQKSLREAERSQTINDEEIAQKDWDKYDKNHAATEAAKTDYENSQKALNDVKTSATNAGTALYQYGQAAKTAGMAAGAAGSMCLLLATALDKAGNTKAAKTFRIIGTTLTVLSGVFMVVGQAAQVAAAQVAAGAAEASAAIEAIPIIGWIAAVIAGLIALGSIIATFVETSDEKIARLSEEAEAARQAAQNAAQAYDDLLSAHKDYDTRLEEIQKLTKGTQEYTEAVKELNAEVFQLNKNYPNLEYTYNKETGLFEVDEESWKKAQTSTKNRKNVTNAIATLSEANLQLEKDINDINTRWVKSFQKIDLIFSNQEKLFREDGLWLDTREGINFRAKMLEYVPNPFSTEEEREKWGEIIGQVTQNNSGDFLYKDKNYGGTIFGYSKAMGAAVEDYLSKFPDDIDVFDSSVKAFKEAVLLLSDFEPETVTAVSLSGGKYQTILTENRAKDNEWENRDFSEITDFERKYYGENTSKTRWDFIVEQAFEQGLINFAQKQNFLSGKNNEKNDELLAAAISGESYETVKEQGYEYAEAVLGGFYESTAGNKLAEFDEKTLNDLAPELREALITAVTDTQNLSKEQIELLKDNWKELFGNGTDENKGLFEYANTSGLEEVLENIVWEGPNELVESNYYSRAAEAQWKELNKYGEDFSKAYATLFEAITDENNGLSKEQRQTFLNLLNTADVHNIEQLWDLFALLKEEGIDLTNAFPGLGDELTTFIEVLQNAGVAIKKWTYENLENSIKSGRGLKNQILEGDLQYIWSKEQYEQFKGLVEKTGDTGILDKFVDNLDDTYTYSSSDLNPIIAILNKIEGDLGKEYKEGLQTELQVSNQLQETRKQGINVSRFEGNSQGGKWVEFDLVDKETTRTQIEDFSKEDQLTFYNKALESIDDEELLNRLGLPKNITQEDLSDYLPLLLDLWFNNEEIRNKSLIGTGLVSGQELLNYGYGSGATEEEETEAGKRLRSTVLTDEEATGFMTKNNEEIDKADEKILALAKDWAILNRNIKAGANVISDEVETLKKGKAAGEAYITSLGKAQKALKKIFGRDFSEEEIQQLLPSIEKWINGEEEGWDELVKYIEDNKIKPELKDAGLSDEYDAIVSQMEGQEIGIKVNLENQSIVATKEQMDALTAALAARGITAIWEPVPSGTPGLDNYKLVFAANTGGGTGGAKSSGGGGGGGKKEFKNDFDKYYNMVEDINELQRLRNLLETDYNQLLESEAATGKQIFDNLKQQIKLLRERRDITADLAEKRKQQIIDETQKKENKDLTQYAWWNESDLTIEIDWDKINAVKDSELGDRIKEYVKTLEDFQSKYDEQIEALEDIESTLQEIEKRGRDEYTSLEDRVRDALIKQIQDKIDELTAVDEAINDANQKLFDSISKTLEKQRQERENAKTEEELADKQQRLEYLRQDSSGANAVEIAKLEEELAEAREDYTDTLIDQKISELQEQNEEAAQQRQEQIDLLQQSLDWQEKSGAFWEQVYEYIQAGTDEVGSLVHGSELENLLKAGEAWDSLSQEGQMNWLKELETMVAQAIGYLALTRQLEELGTKEGTKITFTDAEGNTHTGTVDKNGNVVVQNEDGSKTIWKDVYQSYDGSYRTLETEEDATTTQKPATNSGKPSNGGSNGSTDGNNSGEKGGWNVKENADRTKWERVREYNGPYTIDQADTEAAKRNANRLWSVIYNEGKDLWEAILTTYGSQTHKEAQQQATTWNDHGLRPYKTGGMNYQTGPAWLDGTPSRPEAVLNARDTQNFIQLRDTLADLRKSSGNNELGGGDNYFEIAINVDKIDSDYDVDRMAARLKTLIYQDGAYRNVNTLSRLR